MKKHPHMAKSHRFLDETLIKIASLRAQPQLVLNLFLNFDQLLSSCSYKIAFIKNECITLTTTNHDQQNK